MLEIHIDTEFNASVAKLIVQKQFLILANTGNWLAVLDINRVSIGIQCISREKTCLPAHFQFCAVFPVNPAVPPCPGSLSIFQFQSFNAEDYLAAVLIHDCLCQCHCNAVVCC